MENSNFVISGKWLENLKKQIIDHDFCFLCDNHPTHGHDLNCPLKGIGEVLDD